MATQLTRSKPSWFSRIGAMLKLYQCYTPKPSNIAELKNVLQAIWADLPQGPIDASILSFRKRLNACIKADGGHFEHCCWTLWLTIEYVICSLLTFTRAGSFACICDAAIATFSLCLLSCKIALSSSDSRNFFPRSNFLIQFSEYLAILIDSKC